MLILLEVNNSGYTMLKRQEFILYEKFLSFLYVLYCFSCCLRYFMTDNASACHRSMVVIPKENL